MANPSIAGWRYRCANGHVTVVERGNNPRHGTQPRSRFYCPTCKDHTDRSPHYDHVVDAKTDEAYPAGSAV